MKRMIVATALLMSLFCGCSKQSNMLVGTTWVTDDNFIMSTMLGYKYQVYEFFSEDMVSSYYTNAAGAIVMVNGDYNYKLDYPNLVIYDSTEGRKFEFTSRLSFKSVAVDPYTYYKK